MKRVFCILLIIANILILNSCAKLKIENDSSSLQSQSSISSESKENKTNEDSSNNDKNNTIPENKHETKSEGDKSSSNINININNGTNNEGKSTKSVSTKKYYLQKLDGIQDRMSDLENLRAGTTLEMRQAASTEYKRWDDALNEIYSVLKGQLSSSEMNRLEKEEVEWIAYKEKEAQRCANDFKGGTAESLIYTSRLAELTRERCYYLVNNYMK